MPMFWIVHRVDDAPTVFLQNADAAVFARLKAAITGFPGTFVEIHALDQKTEKKVPKTMVGRVLSQTEAAMLLNRLR